MSEAAETGRQSRFTRLIKCPHEKASSACKILSLALPSP